MSKHVFQAATLAAAAGLALAPLGAASAATSTFHDRAGDVRHGGDLRSVTVANKPKNVWVTVTTRDLTPAPSAGVGGAVFLDTDGQPGPEYVAVGGFFEGTDYSLQRTDSWNVRRAGARVDCSYRMRLDYARDTVTFRIGTGCLAAVPGSGRVRVEVRTGATTADGAPRAVDWLGAPRTFSRPVARG